MADIASKKPILMVCATTSSKVKDISITNGQLIFVQDTGRIAFDFGNKRVFYNQIIELATEQERLSLETPVSGQYYFVIETAVLWNYQSEWIQITSSPKEIVFIGTELPELGSIKNLYIDKKNKNISIWDGETSSYEVVGETTTAIPNVDIEKLFN